MKIIFLLYFWAENSPEKCCDALSYRSYIFGIYYDWRTSEYELFLTLKLRDKGTTALCKIIVKSFCPKRFLTCWGCWWCQRARERNNEAIGSRLLSSITVPVSLEETFTGKLAQSPARFQFGIPERGSEAFASPSEIFALLLSLQSNNSLWHNSSKPPPTDRTWIHLFVFAEIINFTLGLIPGESLK